MRSFVFCCLAGLIVSQAGEQLQAGIMTFGNGANSFGIDFVTIDRPNNSDDTSGTPALVGSVAYEYQISRHEISEVMISRFNASQSLQISKDSRGADKPVTGVSWNEAARFVNWLNTSQGFHAAYNFTTNGVNDNISLWSSSEAWNIGGENLFRHKDAHFWLPSMDEWYKAAYYNGSTGTYSDYGTGSNSAPAIVASGTSPGSAVYGGFLSGPADITQAGGLNPFGVMGMSGNVWEWEESSGNSANNSATAFRGYRGGYWANSAVNVSSSARGLFDPTTENPFVGFRVAGVTPRTVAVPEPTSIAFLIVSAVFGMAARRQRRQNG